MLDRKQIFSLSIIAFIVFVGVGGSYVATDDTNPIIGTVIQYLILGSFTCMIFSFLFYAIEKRENESDEFKFYGDEYLDREDY